MSDETTPERDYSKQPMTDEELHAIIDQAEREGWTELDLSGKGLRRIPPEIGRLKTLTKIRLMMNKLERIPREIVQLVNLLELALGDNIFTDFPEEVLQITSLQKLYIPASGLRCIPSSIGGLLHLIDFSVYNNNIEEIPEEFFGLLNLENVYLGCNPIRKISDNIVRLRKIVDIDISGLQIGRLPSSIGLLENVSILNVYSGSLLSPPSEIVSAGTKAILAFLREQHESGVKQWISKMLVVGQGGVGKTSLLRSLKGESFDFQETTTRGVALGTLDMPCPNDPAVAMQLNTWDFGGQEIYHATHQFFLTNRSLFVLVWNARQGFEQGRLYYWLDTITALAPDSPILIVATWTDERDPDLPLAEIRAKYPRVVGQWAVSNQTRAGIDELRDAIAQTAADLPLMGEIWPGTWLSAANALRARPEKYISPNQLFEVMSEHGVSEDGAPVLARWLHELGEILYFRDSEELRDIVILKPQWVTEYISKVLESDEVIDSLGLYTREHMVRLWYDLEPPMREHFLKLMERFDLSYRTLDNREISLVVERLPLDEAPYQEAWEVPLEAEECNEIAMRFRLDATMPAGVPTWFIARTHRFTTKTHWRTGALFADGPDRRHVALVRAFPHDRYLELAVRGPAPQNFFALLKDGIEVTLARFPGLPVRRMIPCPGHAGQACRHEFDHDQLIKRLNKKPTIECPEAIEDVSVAELLFGWDWNTRDAVLEKIEQLRAEEAARHEAVVGKLSDLTQLVQREFAVIFRREQAKDESHCPSVFVLRPPEDAKGWGRLFQGMKQAVMGQPITLQLYCQAPGCWHPTRLDGRYTIEDPAEWFKALSPILRRLIPVLKFAVPLVGPWMSWVDPQLYERQFKADIELMDALAGSLGDFKLDRADSELADAVGEARDPERAEGSALRALRKLLDEKDPQQHWGGLKKVLTPEGHYLWLCEHHARAYAR